MKTSAQSAQQIDRLYQQALSLYQKGQHTASFPLLKQLVSYVPHHFPAWTLLADIQAKKERPHEAIQSLQESLRHCPEYYPARIQLARLTHQFIRNGSEMAISLLKEVIAKNPDVPEPYLCLHQLYTQRFQYDASYEALTIYLEKQREANEKGNEFKVLTGTFLEYEWAHRLWISPVLDSLEQEALILQKMQEILSDRDIMPQKDHLPVMSPHAVFYLAYYDTNVRPYLESISLIYRTLFPDLNFTIKKSPIKNQKIRIGIVSSYLGSFHAIHLCYAPLIQAISRDLFELVYFRLPHEDGTAMGEPLSVQDTLGKIKICSLPSSLQRARTQIVKEGVDILWYIDIGMNAMSYWLAYARLAPVQCASGGHPVTLGISTIDAYLSSRWLEADNDQTNDQAQEHYTEKLIQLPCLPVIYQAPVFPENMSQEGPKLEGQKTVMRSIFHLPENQILYFCGQSLFKIHPKMDIIFKSILEKDEKALIVFSYAGNPFQSVLEKRWKKTLGSLAERCVFIPLVPQESFYHLLQVMDVVIDTTPFGGGNTTLQAISIGVPVVSFRGSFMRGAVAASLYKRMKAEGDEADHEINLEDLLADTPEECAEICLDLARHPEKKNRFRGEILKHNGVIFESPKVVAEIKAAYETVFQELYNGRVS